MNREFLLAEVKLCFLDYWMNTKRNKTNFRIQIDKITSIQERLYTIDENLSDLIDIELKFLKYYKGGSYVPHYKNPLQDQEKYQSL